MAVNKTAGEPAAPTWLNATLNGGGSWNVRRRVPWLLGLIMLFDSWDSVVIAFTLPSISQEWALGPVEGGLLMAAGYGGQFVGAILCGWIAERTGRGGARTRPQRGWTGREPGSRSRGGGPRTATPDLRRWQWPGSRI